MQIVEAACFQKLVDIFVVVAVFFVLWLNYDPIWRKKDRIVTVNYGKTCYPVNVSSSTAISNLILLRPGPTWLPVDVTVAYWRLAWSLVDVTVAYCRLLSSSCKRELKSLWAVCTVGLSLVLLAILLDIVVVKCILGYFTLHWFKPTHLIPRRLCDDRICLKWENDG